MKPRTAPRNATNRPERLAYKIEEAAQLLGVASITIRRAIKRGLLKPIRAFRHPLIAADELQRFVSSNTTGGQMFRS
jgi:excisionase family DNA binding protein